MRVWQHFLCSGFCFHYICDILPSILHKSCSSLLYVPSNIKFFIYSTCFAISSFLFLHYAITSKIHPSQCNTTAFCFYCPLIMHFSFHSYCASVQLPWISVPHLCHLFHPSVISAPWTVFSNVYVGYFLPVQWSHSSMHPFPAVLSMFWYNVNKQMHTLC